MPSPRRPYDIAKRAIDVVVATLGLVLLLPVLVAITLAVFVVDGWPVFFVHHRVGRAGREFPIVKFRTLARDMPRYHHKVPDDDPRASLLGRLLRRTGFDELPQILNVLAGHMSIVGPRPEQPFIVAQYKRWQHRRHDVRPGMTGPWQASGRRRPLEESTEIEIDYIRRRSLGLDAAIMWNTLRYVFHPSWVGRGAHVRERPLVDAAGETQGDAAEDATA